MVANISCKHTVIIYFFLQFLQIFKQQVQRTVRYEK